MRHHSMFGSNFKYVLVLTALAWITYTMPSVRAALETTYSPHNTYAAVSTVFGTSADKNVNAIGLLPSVNIVGTFKNTIHSSKLNVEVGDTFFVYGSPQNLKNLKWGKDYSAEFVYSKEYLDCIQTDMGINPTWILSCKPKVSGEGKVYVKISRGGVSRISNPIMIYATQSTNPPVVVCPKGFICTPGSSGNTGGSSPECPQGYICSNIEPTVTYIQSSAHAIASDNANDDVGMFNIRYRISNLTSADIYIPQDVKYVIDKGGTIVSPTDASLSVSDLTAYDTTSHNNWVIESGGGHEFITTVSVPMGGALTSGQYRVSIVGIPWGTSDTSSSEKIIAGKDGWLNTSYLVLN